MKWLAATFLCLLTVTIATADTQQLEPPKSEEPLGIVNLPSVLTCGPFKPDLDLETEYGERQFAMGVGEVVSVDPGKSYQGIMVMYVNPEYKNWTIVLHIPPVFTCMVMTGEGLAPVIEQGIRL